MKQQQRRRRVSFKRCVRLMRVAAVAPPPVACSSTPAVLGDELPTTCCRSCTAVAAAEPPAVCIRLCLHTNTMAQ
jgi:hypothetical protein